MLYDTTLRDGAQQRGISFSLEDKIKITSLLDEVGFDYVEGGWPGSNPKDCKYFQMAKDLNLKNAKIVAFGSTRKASSLVKNDVNIQALLQAETEVVTLVGKSWDFHVTDVLKTSLEENLKMISQSISFMKENKKEVIYDAEHFFDAYTKSKKYALKTILEADKAGADTIVLCDTNGGFLPWQIKEIIDDVKNKVSCNLGIHVHNDSGVAVANSLMAVQCGVRQIQGTINGLGERCGNANLITLIPTLYFKMGYQCLPPKNISKLTLLSKKVSDIANLNPEKNAPYVGSSAFAHKGGIHVSAVEKNPTSYEHIDPELVGNKRQFVVSELAGKGNIRMLANKLKLSLNGKEGIILEKIKKLESEGSQFENAEGSFELLLRRDCTKYIPPFKRIEMKIISEYQDKKGAIEAMVKLSLKNEIAHIVAEGDGPVHALDNAIRKALVPYYPDINDVHLIDYKVRILNPDKATGATTRVSIEAKAGDSSWITIGVSDNIINASYEALLDAYELFLLRNEEKLKVAVSE